MSSPLALKGQKYSPVTTAPPTTNASEPVLKTLPAPMPAPASTAPHTTATTGPQASAPSPLRPLNTIPPPSTSPASPTNPRKRRASRSPKLNTLPPGTSLPSDPSTSVSISALLSDDPVKKKSRTNQPWTPAEEQRLKQMRDAGNSWGEIAKAFPNRTEGGVKKHWYKDMHYAEFAEDESVALREAIKEYESNKWKAIGAKLGKPAKACEQYAREHFKNL